MRVNDLLSSAVPVHVQMLVGEFDCEADLHILEVDHYGRLSESSC